MFGEATFKRNAARNGIRRGMVTFTAVVAMTNLSQSRALASTHTRKTRAIMPNTVVPWRLFATRLFRDLF